MGCLCFALVAAGMAAAPDVPCLSGIGAVSVSAETANPVYVSEVDLGQILNYENGTTNCPTGVKAEKASYTYWNSTEILENIIELTLTQSGTYKFSGSNLIGGAYVDVKIIVPADVEATVEFAEGSTIINECGDYKYTNGIYYSYTDIGGYCCLCDYAVPFRVEANGSLQVTGDLSIDTYSYYGSCDDHGKHGNSVPLYEGTGTFTADYFTVKYVDGDGLTIDQKYYLNKPADPVKDGCTFGGWYTDTDFTTPYDFTSAVEGNVILYPKWIVEVDVEVDLNDLLDQYINGRGQNTGSMEYAEGVTVNKSSYKYIIDLNSGFYKFTGSNMVNGAYVDVMIQNNGVTADVEFDNASIINSEYYISTDDSLAYGTVPFSVYGGKLTVSGTLSVDTIADYHGTNNRVDDLFYATGSGEFNAGDFFEVKYVDEDGNVIDKNYYLGGNGQTYDVKPSSYVGSDEKMHSISEEFPCVPSIVKNVSENKTISARKTHIDEDSDHECDNCGVSAKLTGIEIDTAPTKTSYFIGQELDVTGGTITVSYEFGDDKTVDITADMISGFDNTKEGNQTLTVTYGGLTDTFDVTFSEAKITDIELYSTPAKTSYSIGDKLDVTGGRLKVFYEDGSSDIIDITADMVTGFDSTKEGTNALTVTYGGKTVTFTVTIEKGAVTILPSDNNVGGAVIDMPIEDLMAAVLDEEDLELIAQGVDIGVLMATVTIDPEYVPEADKTAIDDVLNDFTIGCYLDVKLFKTYSNGTPDRQVTDPNAPITISFEVPQYIIDQYPENEYVYSVFCSHNEIGYSVESRYDADTNIMSFSSKKFSTYALGVKPYAEYSITSEDSHVTVEGTANAGDTVKVIVDDGYQATVSDADGNVIAEITGTGTFTMPDCDVTITCEQIIISEPSKSVVYYSISTDSHVTVNGTKYKEGDKVSYRVDDFYEAVIYVNGRATGRISGSGSFTMPAADVRIVSGIDEISYAMLTASVVNSYVYSYDSDMNPIKTSGTKKKNNYIIIDLGEEYAGRTITIYKGRKSTNTVVAEGVLDKNGKFKFENAGFGSNYTLIVGD